MERSTKTAGAASWHSDEKTPAPARLRGKTPGHEQAVHTRHLEELDQRLRQSAESLMPDQLVEALAEFLHAPESSLALTPVSITVDRLGIVSDSGSNDANVHTLDFPELNARDKRHYLVILARISRDGPSTSTRARVRTPSA